MNLPDNSAPTIVWFREDLRLADNPALADALATGGPVIPLFIHENEPSGKRQRGAASHWWLHHSLASLSKAIAERGNALCLLSGDISSTIEQLAKTVGAGKIVWNRRYGSTDRERDGLLKKSLESKGIAVRSFNGKLLNEPWTITNKSGNPFRVFTPYWKSCRRSTAVEMPLPAPAELPACSTPVPSDRLGEWNLLPKNPNWAVQFAKAWQPGETGAAMALDRFVSQRLAGYSRTRDVPSLRGTSLLSPHLAFGEISPRQIWWAVQTPAIDGPTGDVDKFLAEIGWREFAYHILFHHPHLATENFQTRFNEFYWADPGEELKAWQQGRTGYPIVDAAMRQLWNIGWMHNRCRMITGSFLTKHLLLDWRLGERWFWDTLVDADPANNPAGWQWIAGSGADAAPYFRIFNPVLQSRKFDPEGTYIRTYCPELKNLDNDRIHAPWTATDSELQSAGVQLGENYPRPIIDHKAARDRALSAYSALSRPDSPGS